MAPRPDRSPRTAADARAEVEAGREARRAELDAAFADRYGDARPGRRTVVADTVATVVLALLALLAALAPSTFVGAYFVYSLGCFLVGSALFFLAMLHAARRSRRSTIGIGGLFFLAGTAPTWPRRPLLGLLAAQVVVTVAAAAVRPFTPLAFGTLAPLLGLGFCGWWSARFGIFPARGPGAAAAGDPA